MNCPEGKLSGLNLWFIIEILSFYGYILSAAFFIFEHSIKSSFGYLDKTSVSDCYKFDFLAYYRRDCDWYAFITILLTVNLGLLVLDATALVEERKRYKRPAIADSPLQNLMW
jgi:hypothetical protein